MKAQNIFIAGSKGQLGKALCERYPLAQAVDIEELDITNAQQVDDYNWSDTQVIINAAAYTNVDGAETPEGRRTAWSVNALAVANLARVAIHNEILLVHISSDYVFDGTKAPHKENETFSPLNVYGASKAAADIAVSQVANNYLLRSSWVIGDGKNFVRTMLDIAKKGKEPTVVSDQIGRPTFTSVLVDAIDFLLEHQAAYGIYNVSNDGKVVSWADFCRQIFKLAGYNNQVKDISTKNYFAGKENVATRLLNSVFDLSKIKSLGFEPKEWQEDLKIYIDQELNK